MLAENNFMLVACDAIVMVYERDNVNSARRRAPADLQSRSDRPLVKSVAPMLSVRCELENRSNPSVEPSSKSVRLPSAQPIRVRQALTPAASQIAITPLARFRASKPEASPTRNRQPRTRTDLGSRIRSVSAERAQNLAFDRNPPVGERFSLQILRLIMDVMFHWV
jgi:hypothetical protein